MVFSSTIFLFLFLPATMMGYYLLKEKYRNYWLLLVSLIFFTWSQPRYCWLILVSILINYAGALLIANKLHKKVVLTFIVCLNIFVLFYYKYYNFAIESFNVFLGTNIALKNIVLPIGISFFTFQGMSYVIDVYREEVSSQKNPCKVALYIALFPQLVAGPIVRYKSIAKEIDNRKIIIMDFVSGIERFIIGLSKKAILANTLAATADAIWAQGAGNNAVTVAWLGSIAYSLQIYFDFSGYSDMAIGLGRMFGFHFDENFNYPYVSKSITEFWRRWHISLSSWFRDYVYIPLGGNRKHVYSNLAIIFLLTGIWHGAAWHFVVWGVWHGVFVLTERLIRNKKKIATETITCNKGTCVKKYLSWIYTIITVNFGWILFRADNMADAKKYIFNMFGIGIADIAPVYSLQWYLNKWFICILIIAIIYALNLPGRICNSLKQKYLFNPYGLIVGKYTVLLGLFGFSIMRVVAGTYNPFIYFQF